MRAIFFIKYTWFSLWINKVIVFVVVIVIVLQIVAVGFVSCGDEIRCAYVCTYIDRAYIIYDKIMRYIIVFFYLFIK